jgi:hypothetical protein|tara:strand:+ start:97 stop:426 length:330 start_codon:yes stop_codon:yes gene_type:complete
MELLQYENSDDEDDVILTTNCASTIQKLDVNDPRRKSADIAKIQQNKEMFNPKLITAWNEKWNLDLGGSNIEKTSVHGQSFNKSDQLISLVEEAQQHTRDVSEGRKTRA